MTRNLIGSILLTVLLSSVNTLVAQIGDPDSDPRVKTILNQLDLNYSIAESGDFKVIFDMNNGRTQMVIIHSSTYKYEGMEIREIVSNAAMTMNKSDFTQSVLFNLLELNQTYKLGAWQIHGGEPPYLLQFGIRISANSTKTVLDDAIRLAAKMGDEMEQLLTDGDDH